MSAYSIEFERCTVLVKIFLTGWMNCCTDVMSVKVADDAVFEHTTLQMYSFSTLDVYEKKKKLER